MKDIFHEALSRPARNRAGYLQEACREDLALKELVLVDLLALPREVLVGGHL